MIAIPCRRITVPTLLALLLALAGCAGLKPLTPLDPARKAAVLEECRRPFLPEGFRLVHALETVMPGGGAGTAIGVLVADPRTRAFRTALMTIEGFVLFDAEAGQTLTVHRAVPPFDKPAFAEGLAADVRLAFFQPGGEPAAWGEGEEGARMCRYELPDGRMEEVSTFRNGEVEIRLYGDDRTVQKRVKMAPLNQPGLAETVEIRGGWPPYGLRLRLLESEALDSSAAVPETPAGADAPGPGHEKEKRMP
ncbi:MAG: hypothetical protein LLG97_12440 [Deltaproteobacteria bacterium]|nr:hypothetical protein [Deltaproteobacteria bacterium]